MPTLKVPTSFNIELEFEIPDFSRRMLALVIDIIIQVLYLILAAQVIKGIVSTWTWDADDLHNLSALWMIFMVPIFTYHFICELLMNGQSWGKRAMGLRVVNENGGRAGASQFAIRWLLRISDTWLVALLFILVRTSLVGLDAQSAFIVIAAFAFLLTDIILVVSSSKGQRIGDTLAKTILINTNTDVNISETVFQEVETNYTPVFPQIMQLSDKDINAIKSILESTRRRTDHTMAESAAAKIKAHLGIHSDLGPIDFLDTLLKDYNYLSVR